jgi:nitrous oxide reductase family maturation protein NosD
VTCSRVILAILVVHIAALCASGQQQRSSMDAIQTLIESAQPGDTIVVPPGIYEGHLVLKSSITLEGNGLATLDGQGTGSVVEIHAADVTIRGFTIQNSGTGVDREPAGIRGFAGPITIEDNEITDVLFGIDLREAPGSIIRNNTIAGQDLDLGRRGDGIRLWWSHKSIVEDNEIIAMRDMVFWYSEDLSIARNHVTNSRYGLHFMYSHNTVLKDNDLEGNSVGIYLMYSNNIRLVHNRIINNRGSSGYAIGLKDCDGIVIEDNALLANRVGIYLDNSPSSIDSSGLIDGNMIAFNEIGLLATPITHDNVITDNAFVENDEQVTAHGGGQLTLNTFSKDGVGNFWSTYAGFDQDNDGIGDFPHEPRSLFRSLLAREPNLRIFLHSPAQQAIELTARAFPELRPEPIFVDPAPLTRPPKLDLLSSTNAVKRGPMSIFSIGLLSIAGLGGWLLAHQQRFPTAKDSAEGKPSRRVPV